MKKIVSMALVIILMINSMIPLTSLAISDIMDVQSLLEDSLIDDNDVVKSNPGISKLEIIPEQGKKLIHSDLYYRDGFENDVFEYNYYLLSTDTKDLQLKVSVDRPKYTLDVETTDINGLKSIYNVIDDTARKGELDFNADIIKTLDVTVTLDGNAGDFTYTINIISTINGELDPKIHLSVKKDVGKEYADLLVTLENTDTNALAFSLYNVTSDTRFTDKNGKPFTDMNEKLEREQDNYYQFAKDSISLDYMRSDGQSLYVTASSAKSNGIIRSDEEGLDVYSFRMSAKASDSAKEILQNLSLVAGDINDNNNIINSISSNVLFDYRYIDVRQLIDIATDEKIKRHGSKSSTLVYIDTGSLKKLEVYIRHLTSDDLVNFIIENQADSTQVTTSMTLDNGKASSSLPEGIYSIIINSKGYLTYNKGDISMYVDKDTYLNNITLIAGDVDDDGDINAGDRMELLKVYNHNAKDGEVDIAGKKVAADFNNDEFVNALDFGELLRNIGRFYK